MIALFPERAIALSLFGWDIHWYGVLYVVSFILAWRLLPKLQHWRGLNLTRDAWFELVTYAAVGVIIGGRLGYVAFYEPGYFLQNPAEIFFLSQGGMSLHGGLIGVGLALWLAARRIKAPLLSLLDVGVPVASLGIAVGRVGNVINQELFISELGFWLAPLGPLVIAAASFWALTKSDRTGIPLAVFVLLSAIWRFGIEYLREQPFVLIASFSRGQVLSLLLALGGVLLLMYVRSRTNQETAS